MNNFFKTIIAAYGAKKLGGGCLSTILVFIIIYWALGNCNSTKSTAPAHSSIIKTNSTTAALVPNHTANLFPKASYTK